MAKVKEEDPNNDNRSKVLNDKFLSLPPCHNFMYLPIFGKLVRNMCIKSKDRDNQF